MTPLISNMYLELKQFLLNDSRSRAANETPSVTKLSHNIWLTDKYSINDFLSENPQIDGVISIGSKPSVNVDQLYIDLADCPFTVEPLKEVSMETVHKKAQYLLDLLKDVSPFINQHQYVLMHCTKGMSRSCFVYLFYELRLHHITHKSFDYILLPLLKILKSRRTCCMIGDKFLYVLAYYEYLFIIKKINDSVLKTHPLPSLD